MVKIKRLCKSRKQNKKTHANTKSFTLCMFLLHGGNYSRSEQLVTPKDAYLTLLLMVKGVCSSNYHYHSCGKNLKTLI